MQNGITNNCGRLYYVDGNLAFPASSRIHFGKPQTNPLPRYVWPNPEHCKEYHYLSSPSGIFAVVSRSNEGNFEFEYVVITTDSVFDH